MSELGGLDVVVNAAAPRAVPRQAPGLAGLETPTSSGRPTPRRWARGVRAVAPYLEHEGGGWVVNVSGMNARVTGSITGSVRNIAVVALTKNLADELGPGGVSVTCVHPGATVTERVQRNAAFAEVAGRNSLARPVAAQEIAAVVGFLASPRGRSPSPVRSSPWDGGRRGPISAEGRAWSVRRSTWR